MVLRFGFGSMCKCHIHIYVVIYIRVFTVTVCKEQVVTSWQRPKQICRQIHLTRCHILGGRPEGSAGAAHGSGASTGSGRGGAGKMADGSMCRSRGTFLWVGGGRLSTGASHGSPMWRIFSHGGPSRSRSQSQSQSQSLRHRHEVTCICRYLYIYIYVYVYMLHVYICIYIYAFIYLQDM